MKYYAANITLYNYNKGNIFVKNFKIWHPSQEEDSKT